MESRRAPLLFWPGKQAHLKPPTTHLSRDAAAVAEVEEARRRMDEKMDEEKLKLDAQARATEWEIRRKEALEKKEALGREQSVAKARQQRLLHGVSHGSDTLMEALEQDRLLTMAERKAKAETRSNPTAKPPHALHHGASPVSAAHAKLTLEQALDADAASQNSVYSHAPGASYRPNMVRDGATVHILSTQNSNCIW